MKMNKEDLLKLVKLVSEKVKQDLRKEIKEEIKEEIKFALSLLNENNNKNIQNDNINNNEIYDLNSNNKEQLNEFKNKIKNHFQGITPPNATINGHAGTVLNLNSEEGKKLIEIQTKDYSKVMKSMFKGEKK